MYKNKQKREIVAQSIPLFVAMVLMVGDQAIQPAWSEYADVVLNNKAEDAGMRPVIYPHWFHRIRFRCKVCHYESGFAMRVGSVQVVMADIMDGKFCGACHNGKITWGAEFCDRCHSGYMGLETGIQGERTATGKGGR